MQINVPEKLHIPERYLPSDESDGSESSHEDGEAIERAHDDNLPQDVGAKETRLANIRRMLANYSLQSLSAKELMAAEQTPSQPDLVMSAGGGRGG